MTRRSPLAPHGFALDRISSGLPAAALVPQLRALAEQTAAAGGSGVRAVIEAPPGTGKTTVVPPALAAVLAEGAMPGGPMSADPAAEAGSPPPRILVTRPRRMAARAAAARLAQLSGLQVGEEVGFTVRGESQAGRRTRIEFVTTGVLLRRLLRDPELGGVQAVVLDEVHERSLDTDLAFGMLHELAELREDLSLLAMSATLDAGAWAELLGEDGAPAPVLSIEAVTHPLTVRWAPPPQRALDARGVRPDFLVHMAETVHRAVEEAAEDEAGTAPDPGAGPADVLVFAPGRREVERLTGLIRDRVPGEVLTLTGSTPPREQQRILAAREGATPASRRRIVVATSVAESALTVPGVRVVVDSCLARVPHFDTGRGMGGLVTVRESKASGAQRAGRAARLGPGTVWRCCAESDWAAFPAAAPPEVLTADLTSAVLDLAVWGSPGGAGLPLPTALPTPGVTAAARTLHGLGALESADPSARATALGRRLSRVPADPRTARGLLLAAPLIGTRAAAECAALLSADVRVEDGDLAEALRRARKGHAPAGWAATWTAEAKRLAGVAGRGTQTPGRSGGRRTQSAAAPLAHDHAPPFDPARLRTAEDQLGLFLALSRPEQLARRRESGDEYLLASGTGVQLPRGSRLHGEAWIAVAEVGLAGERPLLRAGVGIDEDLALWAGEALRSTTEEAAWAETDSGAALRARKVERLGAIVLSSTPVPVGIAAARRAVARRTAEAFAALTAGTEAAVAFADLASAAEIEEFELLRGRLGLLHATLGAPWPDVRADALTGRTADNGSTGVPPWLEQEVERAARALVKGGRGSAVRMRLHSALQALLPWPEAARLDELAPLRVEVPSGSHVRLRYPAPEAGGAPVLAVKLQEMFGAETGPAVVLGRVPVVLHLLSPARRQLAVTADLSAFWSGAYAQVRAENRGKYLKHPWPEDPRTATATALTKKRAGLQ
ncbi:ATP-dependent helicase C-terminal domain-containing protein [Brevibacterium sp.]|uniref:ATP-dependent RNA helicase n=1 Tax=Brevibacterium sp. TaxID=1701 RepID=UPI0025BC4ED2|nr:ATP-dependent helicase C-terminal domain-containing protein [Brevibacterium sp.]